MTTARCSCALAHEVLRCDALCVDERYASQRFLEEPSWASGRRPERQAFAGLDLSDLSGLVPASDMVRRAARNVSPLSLSRPSAWMLRDAIAKAHKLDPGQIFPRPSMDLLIAPILRAFVGAEDHVALARPCRPEFYRQTLAQGARYVDIGRAHNWQIQHDALERLLGDGALRAIIVGRPNIPTGALAPLSALRQALHAGLVVIVDETQLAYAAPSAGLPRAIGPKSESALRLFDEDGLPCSKLFVLRSIPGIGPGEMLYAVAETSSLAPVWSLDPNAALPAPLAAAAWLALDHSAEARRIIVERSTLRAELKTSISSLPGFEVVSSGAASLMVRRPGTEGRDLSAALCDLGVKPMVNGHPSWRDGVALGIPLAESLERVVSVFQKL